MRLLLTIERMLQTFSIFTLLKVAQTQRAKEKQTINHVIVKVGKSLRQDDYGRYTYRTRSAVSWQNLTLTINSKTMADAYDGTKSCHWLTVCKNIQTHEHRSWKQWNTHARIDIVGPTLQLADSHREPINFFSFVYYNPYAVILSQICISYEQYQRHNLHSNVWITRFSIRSY